MNELDRFHRAWDRQADGTLKLLRALPAGQYDFRPNAGGRSLGQLAWHLAEGDAYMSHGIARDTFSNGESARNRQPVLPPCAGVRYVAASQLSSRVGPYSPGVLLAAMRATAASR